MKEISAGDCYHMLSGYSFRPDSSWQWQISKVLLSTAANMFVISLDSAQAGDTGHALGFAHSAQAFATEEERPYVLELVSMCALREGHTREAMEAAMEAKRIAHARGDWLLEMDACAQLAEVHRAAGNTAEAEKYDEEADRMLEPVDGPGDDDEIF